MKALLGKKIGMTQLFSEETGESTPVTVVDVSGNVVARHNKLSDKITHIELGKDKQKNANKVDLGNYKKLNFVPRFRKFIKVDEEISEIGTELKADIFQVGDIVEVSGVSKGKGFQGVMKRWNFHGGKATHGQSDRLRAPGSISSGTTLGRIFKGQKMAGRMGGDNMTIKNLKIMDIDSENGLISISGSIPGNKNGYIFIKKSEYKKYI